jgi:hypothetical protein
VNALSLASFELALPVSIITGPPTTTICTQCVSTDRQNESTLPDRQSGQDSSCTRDSLRCCSPFANPPIHSPLHPNVLKFPQVK